MKFFGRMQDKSKTRTNFWRKAIARGKTVAEAGE